MKRQYNIAKASIDSPMSSLVRKYSTVWLLALWLLLGICTPAFSQNPTSENQENQYKVDQLLESADQYIQSLETGKALAQAQEALSISRRNSYLEGKAQSLRTLASIYRTDGNKTEALKYYLWTIKVYEDINRPQDIIQVYKEVGHLYLEMRAYRKAIEYFTLYLKGTEKQMVQTSTRLTIINSIAYAHLQLQEYIEAKRTYEQLLQEYQAINSQEDLIRVYQTLSYICKEKEQYQDAITYQKRLLSLYQQKEDFVHLTNAYNSIGFLYKRTGDLKVSLEYFNKGIELSRRAGAQLDNESEVALFINIGIAYTNLSFFSRAKEYYLRALRIREEEEDPVSKAHLHNHLASNYYISGKNAQALKAVMTAIDIAITYDAKEVLSTSYKILSLIYGADNNLTKSQLYASKHEEVSRSLEEKEVTEFEEMLNRQFAIEEKEGKLKALLLEQEQQALSKERRENELILREKELAILKRDQELQSITLQTQQLEREKAEQALALTRQQLQVEKRNRELKELERQKQVQDLRLKQQDLEKEQQEKAIALLEADKKLKEQKLREEAAIRKYGYGIIGLFLLIIGVILFSFFQKKRDNRKLQDQQKEIQDKNEQLLLGEKELRHNMEALQMTQEVLAEQKQQLELEHRKTQESIQYAKRIQFSILPSDAQRKTIIPNSFILYRPKDIVSGDFYWISKSDNKVITSVVDCTGHGVPGALVSLIGNNILNEAINEHQLTSPAEILQYMDKKVQIKLKQEEGTNRDGMDLGLCTLEALDDGFCKVTYSGAKHTLFVMTKGELTLLKGDRKSIGGMKKGFVFSQQEVILQQGDTVYLTTDGFIDQANAQRERFGSKRLRTLISEVHHLSMSEQKQRFIAALEKHQQDTEQRDDINLIGIRL